MKYKLLLTCFFISSQFLHSQTGKIKATVMFNDFPLEGIEIANLVSKGTTITNNSGVFSIFAKVGDEIIFISKNYEYKTITIKEVDFQNTNLVIKLIKKTEELDEVVVFKMPTIKLSKDKTYEQGKVDQLVLEKAAQNPKPLGVYDGTLVNSADLIRIGSMILGIFKKEKEKRKEIPEMEFKTLVNSNLDSDFFKKTLALKPEEIDLFLDFCDDDPNSKNVLNNPNLLKIMDFLIEKNVAFKKLPKN
ncbi:MAG: hypothetical protein H7Y10_14105 [Flavobacterium sp.]|nr:hypothetical protein [Flavobacterium sp.]